MLKTNKDIEKKIIDAYVNGSSFKEIGIRYNTNPVTAFNIIKRNNIQTRTKGGIYELPQNIIVEKYLSGEKIESIAKEYSVNPKTIYNYLEKLNVERNYTYFNRSLRKDYFRVIDSYDKAYFLGFMITDGCVLENNLVSLSLKLDDKYILEIFRQKICNENPLYINVSRNESTFHFKSKETQCDLSKYGVVYRKTQTVFLPLLNNGFMMSHLLRGIFDGDGWVSYKSHNIGLCSASYIFIKYVRDYLYLLLGVNRVHITVSTKNRAISLYQIQWSSSKDIYLIGRYIYHNKLDCFLIRKYNNWLKIIQDDNT